MIHNEEELAFVQEQMARIERALEDLRQDVKNPRNFAVFSEGYVDTIAELKAEIDDYRARSKAKTNGAAKKPKTGKRTKV